MLTVWGRADSSNVQALMWCIGELDLEHVRLDAGHRFGGTDTADFIAMNPNRTVPVMRDGDGDPVWETAAMIRYLAARYGSDRFWPKDPAARVQVDKWAEWAKLNVTLAFTVPVFWKVERTAPRDRDPEAIRAGIVALERLLLIADRQIGVGGFLAGSDLTVADIHLGSVLYRYYEMEIPRAQLANLAAYYRRLTERPAYRTHVMVSWDALRVT